jgi:hypothetical protein
MIYACPNGCCDVRVIQRRGRLDFDTVILNDEGCSYGELARRVNRDEGTIRKRVARRQCLLAEKIERTPQKKAEKSRNAFELANRFLFLPRFTA